MSSGIILGSTFAALHPDRVHRMVIDGVIDPADHYAGAWRTQLDDPNKIISEFSEDCFQAGLRCPPPFANSSADPVEDRLKLTLDSYKYEPVPVTFTSDGICRPNVVTYAHTFYSCQPCTCSSFRPTYVSTCHCRLRIATRRPKL